MKKIRVPKLLLATVLTTVATLAAATPAPPVGITAPYMILTDNTNYVFVDINGTVSFATSANTIATASTTCACSTTLVVASSGIITWSGKLGGFTISNAIGQSKPVLVTPAMDLGLGEVDTTTGGTLQAYWTDTGFAGIAPGAIVGTTEYFIGSGTAAYGFLIDNGDKPYGDAAYNGVSAGSIPTTGNGVVQTTASGPTANPFSMTITETLIFAANTGTSLNNDASFTETAGNLVTPPSPMLTLTKTANKTTVSPYQQVTYTYTVTSTVNLKNVVITDDNATPTYTGDDVTVCTIKNLTANMPQTCTALLYPPVTQGANDCGPRDSFNYSNYHPGGQILCKSLPNGDVQFTYLEDEETSDNTYGNGSSGDWGWGGGYGYGYGSYGSPLSGLLAKGAQFQVFDGRGNKCLDFNADYLTYSNTISGYGSGSISMNSGSGQNVYSYHSSLSDNLNQGKAYAKNCTNNSPSTSANWEHKCAYTVTIKSGAWGSNGFGSVKCVGSNNGNSKGYGHNQHQCQPVNSTVTNTAVATGTAYYGTSNSQLLTSNKPSVTVTIVANPPTTSKCVPLPTTCNIYGQAPSQCKPQGGGHDGDGYSYCDAFLSSQLTCKDGTPFQLGSAYGPSATCGGSIPLPSGKYSHLKFLGAGVNGNQTNQCFTIHYTDGSSTNVYQSLSDWCYPSGYSNESVAVNMPYRIAPDGSSQYISNNLYEYNLPCNSSKTVQSVTLPANRNVVVHAITMVP